MNNIPVCSRRQLLRTGALAAAVAPLMGLQSALAQEAVATIDHGDPFKGLKLGVATYTFMKFSVDDTIKGIKRVGLKYASIKDFHLPMKSTTEERKTVAKKFADAGIAVLSCGVVTMTNNEANVRAAFEYARDAGIPTIVCNPDVNSMPLLDKFVKEFDIKLAIHNHGPESKQFPSPNEVWKAVADYDKRIGLCIDVGHTARTGVDPAQSIIKYKERLFDVHIKDINNITPRGSTLEAGRGVLDLKGVLAALSTIRYTYLLGFEYEKDAADPLPGLAESVGYIKGLLASM